MSSTRQNLWLITAAWAAGLVLSGWSPYHRFTWFAEVLPALIALPLLWGTARKFPFSTLVYTLVLAHGLILMLGGAHTYARVPAGFWVQEWFGLERNPYDKLGHIAQGFVPALVARELLLRYFKLPRSWITGLIVVSICLAFSALYELIEWWAALLYGAGATEFLGTQGYEWDTQADMLYALVGALAAVLFFSRAHDRSMERVMGRENAS